MAAVTKHKESINDFIRNTLKLRIKNNVWSFDAVADNGLVVMKLWQKDRQTLADGTERIRIWRPVPDHEIRLGRKERFRNVQRLKAGGPTFAVVRGFPDTYDKDSHVYENDRLYCLGRVETDPDGTEYAIVVRAVSIAEFLYPNGSTITASELEQLLSSLGGTTVVTKNKTEDGEKNYRPRDGHPGDMLDGCWTGRPNRVEPGAGFALHLVERKREIWLGDYLGVVEDGHGRSSLIVGDVHRFEITDLDFTNSGQSRLKRLLKQNGSVTYSYIYPSDWDGDVGGPAAQVPEGPAYKMAQVKQRLHQRFFRDAVFSRYGRRCVVTGCDVEELLEAAHLDGSRWQDGDNTAENGIPLRVDIHRAYDRGLLELDRDHRLIRLDPSLEQQYGQYRHAAA